MSRKGQPSRPPSSRSVSRQKLHRLTGASAAATRPPSVFNKIPLLPPIGTSAPTAASLSPGSNPRTSVPHGRPATPAVATWSRVHCSSTFALNVKDAGVSTLANNVTVTPSNDDSDIPAACCHQTEHHRSILPDASTVEVGNKHGSKHNSAIANEQQIAESSRLTAGAIGNAPLSQTSAPAVELSAQHSSAKATDSTASDVTEFKPDCSLSSAKIMSEEDIIELPLVSAGSARLKVTDAACQCDEITSDVKSCESGTQATEYSDRQLLASAASTDDVISSTAHPLLGRTKSTDRWSKELVSASSILGVSPSPTHRLRSGASSRTARKFHGLNEHEMQAVSSVLNTLARSQSRAAGSAAAGAPASVAGTNTAEPRLSTTERVRLTVS